MVRHGLHFVVEATINPVTSLTLTLIEDSDQETSLAVRGSRPSSNLGKRDLVAVLISGFQV